MAAVAKGSIKILLVHKIQYTNISKGWFLFFFNQKKCFFGLQILKNWNQKVCYNVTFPLK